MKEFTGTFNLPTGKPIEIKAGIPSSKLILLKEFGVVNLFQYCDSCKTETSHRRGSGIIGCIVCGRATLIG